MSIKKNLEQSPFEISLIVIAILIPLFLEYLPTFADRLTDIFSLPLNFRIIRITSLFLGLIWFIVLLSGLSEFHSHKKNIFFRLFRLSVWLTILGMAALFFSYSIYLLNFFVGYEMIINLIFLVISVCSLLIAWRSFRKNE